MPTDLSHILRSNIELNNDHIRWLMYQLFRAVHYLHRAKVFHRDLKPSNILVNAECDLRLCDFGLARAALDQQRDMNFWTDYVATRWYRAPELIMTFFSFYSTAIDLWSIGCIFGEMLNKGSPMFPGLNGFQVLEYMVKLIGSPSPDAVRNVRNNKAKEYLLGLPHSERTPFTTVFPGADPLACRLLERILVFDPNQRPTAKECLDDPYFADLRYLDVDVDVDPIPMSDFSFERENLSREQLRTLFLEEILRYHPEKRDEYLWPQHTQQFILQPPSQTERFRTSMKSREQGLETDNRNHESLPNQCMVTMWPQSFDGDPSTGPATMGTMNQDTTSAPSSSSPHVSIFMENNDGMNNDSSGFA
uniref:Protein kinase domain-containing protein n=1 Tax=Compsopogon caeruleus TaxID=31354 RepID=A0A6T6CQG7_9RHOD|mmetsp:Transcript_7443/g.15183  ORF Transcript_7443/g.15183 Transcript_7443/m.15183 type:complete len:362 (+) Transcript_7443:593-1678(+)